VHQGETVELRGWVRTLRDQKQFCFIQVNDGSNMSGIQVVVEPGAAGFQLIADGKVQTGEAAWGPGGAGGPAARAAHLGAGQRSCCVACRRRWGRGMQPLGPPIPPRARARLCCAATALPAARPASCLMPHAAASAAAGASIRASGVLVSSVGAKQSVELKASEIEVGWPAGRLAGC
jgi:hypothetical protein